MTDENYEEIDLAKDIEKVNRFARRELSPEEIYCFPLVLCDNEPDRDNERFSVSALEELAKLFVGKTGIFDHDPKGKNQTARIYEAQVLTDPEKTTSDGEVYTYLFAKAYMMKSEKNSDLIKEIDGGIKKEVSVSCSVKKKICSVCGRDIFKKSCAHKKGEVYNGKSCQSPSAGRLEMPERKEHSLFQWRTQWEHWKIIWQKETESVPEW